MKWWQVFRNYYWPIPKQPKPLTTEQAKIVFEQMVSVYLRHKGYRVMSRVESNQDAVLIPFEANGGRGHVTASGRELRLNSASREQFVGLVHARVRTALEAAEAA